MNEHFKYRIAARSYVYWITPDGQPIDWHDIPDEMEPPLTSETTQWMEAQQLEGKAEMVSRVHDSLYSMELAAYSHHWIYETWAFTNEVDARAFAAVWAHK